MYVRFIFKIIDLKLFIFILNNIDFYRIINLELVIFLFIDCKYLYLIGI